MLNVFGKRRDQGIFVFSKWILGTFKVQLQSERGHRFVEIMCHIKVKILS